jgi:hypothetical protein
VLNENTLATIAAQHGINILGRDGKPSRAEKIATIAFSAAETAGGAFAMGYINGRFRTPKRDHAELFGLPVDLTIGTVGMLASLMGLFGPLDSHVASLSAGAAAAYFARLGAKTGYGSQQAADERRAQEALEAAQVAHKRAALVERTTSVSAQGAVEGNADGNVVALEAKTRTVATTK